LGINAVNGKLYAIGGGLFTPAVWEIDPAADKLTEKAGMPTGRTALTTSVVDGKVYAIGGRVRGGADKFGKAVSTVEVYDPNTDTWVEKADMPITRNDHAASVVDGKIYVIGGCTEIWNPANNVPRLDEYDPATDTWTRKADMLIQRCGLAACTVNGKIYAIGGSTISGVSSAVEIYDPATDTWTKGIDMPTARDNLSASAIDGRIYAIGGWIPPNNSVSVVEELDTDFTGQGVLPHGKLPTKWGEVKSD
jgi:N-acetylneuraminic acid mutarotase